MKKRFHILTVISIIGISATVAQTPVTSQAQWAEKNEFHKVMSQTYHPTEEGNFEPIRSRVGELYDKAMAWVNSTPPKEYDRPEIKSALKQMLGEIAELKAMIENKATNEQLKPKMEALHETFHKIVGMCSGEEHQKEQGHDGHHHGDPANPLKEHHE